MGHFLSFSSSQAVTNYQRVARLGSSINRWKQLLYHLPAPVLANVPRHRQTPWRTQRKRCPGDRAKIGNAEGTRKHIGSQTGAMPQFSIVSEMINIHQPIQTNLNRSKPADIERSSQFPDEPPSQSPASIDIWKVR